MIKVQIENPCANLISWSLAHAIVSLLEEWPVRAGSRGTMQEETGNLYCKTRAHLAALLLGVQSNLNCAWTYPTDP